MSHLGAIGLFDSGVGGLSVMREVRRLLPGETLIYFGDHAHCPYGSRTEEQVRQRVFHIAEFLLHEGGKLLVVACNTASIAGLDDLRLRAPQVPIVGMEPAVKPAASATRNGRIGVLATRVALHGERFAALLRRYAKTVQVLSLPGEGLVERVEAGQVDGSETRAWLSHLLAPFQEAGVDTLVLGSTHYSFLRPAIEAVMGPQVVVIDTGEAVARQVVRQLELHGLSSNRDGGGGEILYTSGDPAVVGPVVARLWGRPVPVRHHD